MKPRIFHCAECASTNDLARSAISSGLVRDGDVFTSDVQTRGRGSSGEDWISPKGGLWMSLVVFEPPKPAAFWPGVAIADALRSAYGIDASLKWPNDVLVGSRKIAGVLVERTVDGPTIVGMGTNLLQPEFPGELREIATSAVLEGPAAPVSVSGFRDELIHSLAETRQADLVQRFEALSPMVHGPVAVRRDGEPELEGTAEGLAPDGALRVRYNSDHVELLTGASNLDLRSRTESAER